MIGPYSQAGRRQSIEVAGGAVRPVYRFDLAGYPDLDLERASATCERTVKSDRKRGWVRSELTIHFGLS